jgi:hypothetical protein
VYNDPLKYRDPNGHFPVIIVAVVAIAVALVVMHANAPPVYAPEANWTPPPVAQDPYYSEKSYFDAAPVTGDASDIWAAVTGRTLFTGEELDVTDRALTVGSAALPLFTGGGVRLGRKFIRGIDNVVPGAAMAVRRITAPIGAQTNVAKALRTEARAIFFGANPRLSQELQVHHRIPLEWAHIFPDADPNRLANLVGLPAAAHDQVSARWNTFRARYHGLGREPTPQEVMDYAAEIESEFGQNYRYIEQP